MKNNTRIRKLLPLLLIVILCSFVLFGHSGGKFSETGAASADSLKTVQTTAPAKTLSFFSGTDCSVCSGLGDCMHCFGEGSFYCTGSCIGGRCIGCDDGKVLIGFDYHDNPKYRNCSYCRNGVCRTCGGDGYINCNYCSGTGDCNYCR